MTLSNFRAIAWPRILAEGVAIVASILLAFSIDAWWDERGQQKQAEGLLRSLHEDFQANQRQVEAYLAGNRRIHADTLSVLQQIAGADLGEQVSVPFEHMIGIIGAPTYSPQDWSIDVAIASGRLEAFGNSELRDLLGLWRQQLDDTSEDELLLRDLVINQLVPALGNQVRLGRAFGYEELVGRFMGAASDPANEPFKVRATTELEAILAQKVFYEGFVVDGLEDLRETQAEILQLIEEGIDERQGAPMARPNDTSAEGTTTATSAAANGSAADAELLDFATRYAAAWSGQDPVRFATFFAENGSLRINDADPAVGRAAIEAMAGGFMTGFPDMKVELVELRQAGGFIEFHWRWTGTYAGPGGNGAAVDLVGYEHWLLDKNGLIQESRGHLDDAEYQRQLAAGASQ